MPRKSNFGRATSLMLWVIRGDTPLRAMMTPRFSPRFTMCRSTSKESIGMPYIYSPAGLAATSACDKAASDSVCCSLGVLQHAAIEVIIAIGMYMWNMRIVLNISTREDRK